MGADARPRIVAGMGRTAVTYLRYLQHLPVTLIVLAACMNSPAEHSDPPSAARPVDQGHRLQRAVIVDYGAAASPMAAATMFVPYGWKTSGGIEWGPHYACTNGYAFNWSADAPDGRGTIKVLPQQGWEWSRLGKPYKLGCPLLKIDSAEAYIRANLPPDTRVFHMRRRSDLEREVAGLLVNSDNGFQRVESRASGAELWIEVERNGLALRGVVSAVVLITYTRTGGQYAAPLEHWAGVGLPTYTALVPAADFDPHYFEALRRSFVLDPQWDALITRHNSKMAQIEIAGITDRIGINQNAAQEIARIQKTSWDSQQRSGDKRAREFIEYLRDVETYDSEYEPGGQVQLSSLRSHAWRLEDGTYYLTNNSSFDPGEYLGIGGHLLKVSE